MPLRRITTLFQYFGLPLGERSGASIASVFTKVIGPQAAVTHTHNGAVVTSVSIGVWVDWRHEALAEFALRRSPRVQPAELRSSAG
jgi:hypothetical protein